MVPSMNPKRWMVPALAGLGLTLMGSAWALSSPVGSSPDDDYHLASIWCAWGASESCLVENSEAFPDDPRYSIFSVPKSLDFQCFVETAPASAICLEDQEDGWIRGRVNRGEGSNYPPGFYLAMRAFAGSNVEVSVVAMRIFNSLIAGLLLFAALVIVRPALRRAVALTWLVGVIPFGIWFIASTNPSSWAIISGGLFWAFFGNWLGSRSLTSPRAWWSLGGVIVTGMMGALARSDAALALGVTSIAVGLFLWPVLRRHPKRLLLFLIPFPFIALGLGYRLRSLGLSSGLQLGTMGEDQSFAGLAAQWVRYTGEFPALVAGMLGAGEPEFLQASVYIFGIANQDILLPSLVIVLNLAVIGAVIFWGLSSYSWPKVVALTALTLSMLALPLITLSRFNFANMYQPRYLLPLFLAFVGIAATVGVRRVPRLRRVQTYGLALCAVLVGSSSLLATVRRFTNGQEETWLSFAFEPQWWWEALPHPLVFVAIGTASTVLFTGSLSWLARNPTTGRLRSHP